jgi:hypothetical protein
VAVAGSNPVFRSIADIDWNDCRLLRESVDEFWRHSQVAKATVCKTVILRFKSGCRLQFSSKPTFVFLAVLAPEKTLNTSSRG